MLGMTLQSRDRWVRELETDTHTGDEETGTSGHRISVPGLTVLCHPDVRRIGEQALLPSLLDGKPVEISRLTPAFVAPGGGEPRPLGAPRLSRRPIHLRSEADVLWLDPTEIRGAMEVDGTPADAPRALSANALQEGVVLTLAHRVTLLLHLIEPTVRRPPSFGLVGESNALLRLRREIAQVADLQIPVLLLGESGTGKELVARAIQENGALRDQPFLTVNIGAIPPTLATAELFGAARGAYSGADRRRVGYFQRAHGGTLFLDEIGEASPEVQVLLLRVLETGEIQAVGDETLARVQVRVLAATDAKLDEAVNRGQFRAPLLHRLAGYQISLAPLRQRRDDIGRLFLHFLRQELQALGEEDRLLYLDPRSKPYVPARLLARLALAHWPGNVRQLRNVTRRIAVASRGQATLRVGSWLEAALAQASEAPEAPSASTEDTANFSETASLETGSPSDEDAGPHHFRDVDEVDDDELIAVLRQSRWALQPAANRLGVSRGALYARIDRTPSLRKASDLSREDIERALSDCGGRLDDLVDRLEVSKQGLKMRMKKLGLR